MKKLFILANIIKEKEICFNSTCIASVYVNPIKENGKGCICINFRSGGQYVYDDMAVNDIESLVNAESVGKAYHAIIRRHYKGERVD